LSADDAEELASVLRANREFLAPWDPHHDDSYFTAAGQRAALDRALEAHARGAMMPLAIIEGDGRLAGRVTINTIVRGAFQSADIGYWLSQASNGRGLATAAVADAVAIAFGQLSLHRLQAATLLHNARSQSVLRRNGFRPFAVAPDYLKIAGQWQDHILFHLFNPAG
jgi:ribosomal-protein-alanine N-acetyltransferase